MPSITKKQVESANAKLCNGFKLDVYYYVAFGEKTAVKRVKIGESEYACLKLMYIHETERRLTLYGQSQLEKGIPFEACNSYNVQTGRVIPCVHITKEIEEGNFLKSFGLGKYVNVGEPQNKKLFSVLQKISGTLDINKFVNMAKCEPSTLSESKSIFE